MKFDKNNRIGLIVSVAVHLLLISFLLFFTVRRPEQQEEGGVEVMMGFVEVASGDMLPPEGEPADVVSQQESSSQSSDEPVITQDDEPTVAVEKKKPVKKEESEKPARKEKTAEELRQEREKEAAANANKLISGAFGKGSSMASKGNSDSGKGIQGSVDGNSDKGETSGIGGYGSFSLRGRSLGTGSLPSPRYNVREEGTVVVNIWVNPQGHVIRTSINPRTNTSSPELRSAAEKAARLARFNEVSSVDDQQGTITYVFNLK